MQLIYNFTSLLRIMKKQKIIKSFFFFFWILMMALILTDCANIATPMGGPKDETPPVAISSEPQNHSANFEEREMSVRFNEFVQLKDLYKQILISPPMEYEPEVKIKKRSVVIKLDKKEKLKENTTYTIFLGNAVVDLTESNPYLNFEYVFSTGDYVDSLSIRGNVKNAFTGEPSENVAVMLYADENDTIPLDSLPYKVRPNYVAKTNKEGDFNLFNLRNVPYKIFALNDQNSNYLFDLPYEEVAFIDSMVQPTYSGKRQTGYIDSTAMDSIKALYKYTAINLSMFAAVDSTQYISEVKLQADYKFGVILDFPCDSFRLNPLNFNYDEVWKLDESSKRNDSITFWIKPFVQDTLEVEFLADGKILDTLKFTTKSSAKKPNSGKKKKGGLFGGKKTQEDTVAQKEYIKYSTKIKNNFIELTDKVSFEFSYPIEKFDFSNILWMEDSVAVKPKIYFTDLVQRKLVIDHELKEKTNYELIIPDSSLVDILGLSNDSIIYKFKTRSIEDYGNLYITITPENQGTPWIIQLLNNNDVVLREVVIQNEEKLEFKTILPGKYKFRAINDVNNNGYWDPGNYTYKRQAEKVVNFDKEIEIRANWDYEENWNLK